MKKFYITTSIAYTNAPPHIGFALELIQADVIARYNRSLGKDVFFLTGTDEHGLKIARKAIEAKKTPQDFTNEISEKFKKLTNVLNISNNDFIRTTDKKKHWPNVEKAWNQLKENEDIYKKRYKGLYCVGCEAFVKKKELIDGKCPNHLKKPEVVEEENYFFKLSKYANKVKKEIESKNIKIIPESRENEILSFINQGVEDVSVSRSEESLKWGIPVPKDESQIVYIWFEALINYLFPKDYLPADVHCVGKDIFRFHALMWPAMLIALGIACPKKILVHGFITSEGQKISKSLGNIVDPFELVLKYGIDAVRYFLLREITSTQDGDFTYDKFEKRYNSDLAAGIGNLVARVITMAKKFKIQNTKSKITIENLKLEKEIKKTQNLYKTKLDEFKFNEALIAVWDLIHCCDSWIEKEKPWEGGKKEVINDLLFTIESIAQMLEPFLPETSEKIKKQLKTQKSEILFCRV